MKKVEIISNEIDSELTHDRCLAWLTKKCDSVSGFREEVIND